MAYAELVRALKRSFWVTFCGLTTLRCSHGKEFEKRDILFVKI